MHEPCVELFEDSPHDLSLAKGGKGFTNEYPAFLGSTQEKSNTILTGFFFARFNFLRYDVDTLVTDEYEPSYLTREQVGWKALAKSTSLLQ